MRRITQEIDNVRRSLENLQCKWDTIIAIGDVGNSECVACATFKFSRESARFCR